MNAKFKAFVRSQVIDKAHREFFDEWTEYKDALEFLERDRKYRAFFTYAKRLAEKVGRRCSKDWAPKEFYFRLSEAIQKIENSSRLRIRFVDPKTLDKEKCWAVIKPANHDQPHKIRQQIPKSRRRKTSVLISACELYHHGHEFGHLLIWMGNGERSVNQSLAHIKCLHGLVTTSRMRGEGRQWARVEMICEAVSLIFLEMALKHMVLQKPFYTDFPCRKIQKRKRPKRGACRLYFKYQDPTGYRRVCDHGGLGAFGKANSSTGLALPNAGPPYSLSWMKARKSLNAPGWSVGLPPRLV